jgi:hypothetical protein
MKKIAALTIAAALATASAQTTTITATPTVYTAPTLGNIELGLLAGYENGLSGEGYLLARNLLGPVGVRVTGSYSRLTNPFDYNAVFVGTTTYGQLNPGGSQSGSQTVFGIDATYNVGEVAPGFGVDVYAGPRYSMFSGTNFNASGAAGSTVNVSQFGIGAGILAGYEIADNLNLVADLGGSYYFPGTFSDQNGAVPSSSYATYDGFVNQPQGSFKAKIGISYRF